MEDPYVYQLSRIKWQFFGTLTFTSGRLLERVRLSMYFAMMRKVCKQFRIHFKRSNWCLRLEQGEMLGRWHFHFLLTGLPGQTVTMSTCFFIMNTWGKAKGGHARVRLFDPSLSGVGYTVKCLGLNDPADVYESAKFGHQASQLMLSDGLQEVLKSITIRTERALSTLKEGGK